MTIHKRASELHRTESRSSNAINPVAVILQAVYRIPVTVDTSKEVTGT